jgi:hypothetical protein
LLWIKGREPMPPFWIPPGCRQELTRPDDIRRFAAWSLPVEEHQLDLIDDAVADQAERVKFFNQECDRHKIEAGAAE